MKRCRDVRPWEPWGMGPSMVSPPPRLHGFTSFRPIQELQVSLPLGPQELQVSPLWAPTARELQVSPPLGPPERHGAGRAEGAEREGRRGRKGRKGRRGRGGRRGRDALRPFKVS